jgi:hypothetical protein
VELVFSVKAFLIEVDLLHYTGVCKSRNCAEQLCKHSLDVTAATAGM